MKEIKYRSIWQVMNATNNIEDKYTTIEHLVDGLILEAKVINIIKEDE